VPGESQGCSFALAYPSTSAFQILAQHIPGVFTGVFSLAANAQSLPLAMV